MNLYQIRSYIHIILRSILIINTPVYLSENVRFFMWEIRERQNRGGAAPLSIPIHWSHIFTRSPFLSLPATSGTIYIYILKKPINGHASGWGSRSCCCRWFVGDGWWFRWWGVRWAMFENVCLIAKLCLKYKIRLNLGWVDFSVLKNSLTMRYNVYLYYLVFRFNFQS